MGLKLSEGIIRTTYQRFRSKNPKNPRVWFSAKNRKIPKAIVWPKKLAETAKDERQLNFGLKLNIHVRYNMLTAIWPAPIA